MQNLLPNSVFVSAVAEELDPLRRALLAAVRAQRPMAEVRLGVGDGRLLADVHRNGEVLDTRNEGEVLILRARLDEARAGRLRQAGARVTAL